MGPAAWLPREPSTTAYDKRLSQVQQAVECVRKKVDYVAEEIVELRADMTQIKATMAEISKAIQELRQPAEARPPSLNLPLCTNEDYKAFVSELEKNAGFAEDAITCSAAIREHAAFSNCTVDTIHKSTIDWFHGARDRYGGRSKRRDNTTLPVSYNTAEQYLIHSPSEDTASIPATDMVGLPNMSPEEA
nr:unnamed protein product [Spirometra erinaceieuropaei]